MTTARDRILLRVRSSLGVTADDTARKDMAADRIAEHPVTLLPERATRSGEALYAQFRALLEGQPDLGPVGLAETQAPGAGLVDGEVEDERADSVQLGHGMGRTHQIRPGDGDRLRLPGDPARLLVESPAAQGEIPRDAQRVHPAVVGQGGLGVLRSIAQPPDQ